jgi:hypothetical protein
MLFTAWGFTKDPLYADKLVNRCKTYGVKSIAVEIGFVTAADVKILNDAGIYTVAWNVVDSQSGPKLDELKVDGFMPQIEGPGQYDSCVAALEANVGVGKRKAVITTYAGLDDPTGGKWKKLVGLGVEAAFIECYATDGSRHADLDVMLWQGTQYGMPADRVFAACGTYGGELPPAYKGLDKLNRNFGIYLDEPMSTAQWLAWGGVNVSTVQVYDWVLMAGVSELHREEAKTYSPGDTGLSRMIKWQEGNLDVIRRAGSVKLVRVLRST